MSYLEKANQSCHFDIVPPFQTSVTRSALKAPTTRRRATAVRQDHGVITKRNLRVGALAVRIDEARCRDVIIGRNVRSLDGIDLTAAGGSMGTVTSPTPIFVSIQVPNVVVKLHLKNLYLAGLGNGEPRIDKSSRKDPYTSAKFEVHLSSLRAVCAPRTGTGSQCLASTNSMRT